MAETQTAASASSVKKIVVIGGSYGGISAAHYTLKHTISELPNSKVYQVVLVSTTAEAFCRPAAPRAMLGDEFFDQKKLFVSIPAQFAHYPKENFQFIQGSATAWDHAKRTVTVALAGEGGEEVLEYHALVIATGASTTSPLLGFNAGDEKTLKRLWKKFRDEIKNAKSVVIAGGGPAGIEVAGELGDHLNGRPSWFSSKLVNPKVSITVVTSGSQILPLLRQHIAQTAEDQLAKVGVTVIKGIKVTSTSPLDSGSTADTLVTKTKVSLSDGRELQADLYIPATGMTANTAFVQDKNLLAEDGRIIVNPSTLRVLNAGDRTYAVGDVANAHRPAVHLFSKALPVLGSNIKRDLFLADSDIESTSKIIPEEKKYVEDTRETQLVPIGTSVAVGAAMGWRFPSFLIWLIKGRDYWLWTTPNMWSGNQW
jgi:apoptosis-inducing factor 2